MTSVVSNRRPSALDALGEAFSHMRQKLFPFRFTGWLTLGFVSLLESCGSGGGGTGVQDKMSGPGGLQDPARMLESALGWIAAHMMFFVSALMALMLLSLLLMWLRSRMIFVYIDDVASGRFDLARPWNRHGSQADSFFVVSLVFQGAAFILLVLILGLGGLFVLWAKARDWPALALALGLVPMAFALFLAVLFAALVNMILRDFVAPLQITRNVGARAALGVFFSMLGAHTGLLVGYAFLKLIATVVMGLAIAFGSCLTCCIGFLPLVHQTLFQPVYFAERAWSLKLLAQLGEDVFGVIMPPERPDAAEGDEAPTVSMSRPPADPSDT